ncbi:TPA: RNase H family protein [Vibrio cholerae]
MILNSRLWQTAYALRSEKYVEVQKVRAHSCIRENEIADSLVVDVARSDID